MTQSQTPAAVVADLDLLDKIEAIIGSTTIFRRCAEGQAVGSLLSQLRENCLARSAAPAPRKFDAQIFRTMVATWAHNFPDWSTDDAVAEKRDAYWCSILEYVAAQPPAQPASQIEKLARLAVETYDDAHLSHVALDRAMGDLREALLKPASLPDVAMPENAKLRQILAARVAGPLLHSDDGELQDNSVRPWIDFKRDPADDIFRKLVERALAAQPAEGSALVAPFPERDQSKPAEQQGLFRKFDVRRVDGSDQPGGKHYGCRYYVLDLTHDQHAPAAMRAYAAACHTTHPHLADDIEAEFGIAAPERSDTPALAEVRNAAFEQAASLCDRFGVRGMHPAECAGAIRMMKARIGDKQGAQGDA